MKHIFLTTIFVCIAFGGKLFAQEIITLDNFESEEVQEHWKVEGTTFSLSQADGKLNIVYNRTGAGAEWDQFHMNLDPAVEVNSFNLFFKFQSDVSLKLSIKPVFTDETNEWKDISIAPSEELIDYSWQVPNLETKQLKAIYFYFDGGSAAAKSGNAMMDDFEMEVFLNTTALENAIDAADQLLNYVLVGEGEGQVDAVSSLEFAEAIDAAEVLLSNVESNDEVRDAVRSLNIANIAFENKIIKSEAVTAFQRTATAKSRETANLFFNLQELTGKNVLFGQQDPLGYGVGWSGNNDRSDVEDVCGDLPAFASWAIKEVAQGNAGDDLAYRIKSIYRQGGVNALEWHMDNPFGGDFYWSNRDTDTNVVVGISPNGEKHEAYKVMLDRIIFFLKNLKGDQGESIPVIFRPFHEQNGNWFWWGSAACTDAEYKTLVQFTINYFKENGVNNVMWAYSPDRFNTLGDYLARYAGDEYFDILGLDNYWEMKDVQGLPKVVNQLEIIAELAQSKKKLTAFTETGLEAITYSKWFSEYLMYVLTNSELTRKTIYAAVWRNAHAEHHYAPYPGHASASDFLKFHQDEHTLFMDDLPALYTYEGLEDNTPLDADPLLAMQLKAYPNPSRGHFTLEHPTEKITEVFIYNLDGKLIKQLTVNGHEKQIDLTKAMDGLYIVTARLANNEMMFTRLLVL
ncbi:glycosyl hydrolase [Sediminitomix flava]|uniref:Putative secreted protein (Por secretion system target) n=1 Tax=Sediminitomix flava TaxID=379075 RepID=A0A315ZG77_SEDFL|nr:glycosyl hydrolase [Sediminitomix flava]PWJ44596.1 putative secreted protein (Por secretion system target) [Sediminitomix flava]